MKILFVLALSLLVLKNKLTPDRRVKVAEERQETGIDFKCLLESIQGQFLVLSRDFKVIAASDSWLSAAGITRRNVIGNDVFVIQHHHPGAPAESSLRRCLADVVSTGRADAHGVEKRGDWYWETVNTPVKSSDGRVRYIIHSVSDVTDIVVLREQLRQREALSELARRAGTFAHDFNNLLTVIDGHANLVLEDLQGSPEEERLREIRTATERAAVLTGQLAALSRGSRPDRSDGNATGSAPGKGPGTVLVVEDEPDLRRLLVTVLSAAGYRVLEAADSKEALQLTQISGIDLMLADVMLPGLKGPQLAERMRGIQNGMRVLYMSGSGRDGAAKDWLTGAEFIAKPFTPRQLLDAISAILGARGLSSGLAVA